MKNISIALSDKAYQKYLKIIERRDKALQNKKHFTLTDEQIEKILLQNKS